MAGVEPTAGVLRGTVAGGKFSELVLESAPDAAARRDGAVTYALVEAQSRAAARWAEARAAAPAPQESTDIAARGTPAQRPTLAGALVLPAVLALTLAAVLAARPTAAK